MHLKKILPLALLPLVSACAQVPMSYDDGALQEEPPLVTKEPAPLVAAAPRPARSMPTPVLQTDDELTTPVKPQAPEPEGPPKSVWDRINRGYALPPLENELVREWENWYANRPDYVARMIHRSSRFLFHVVEELEKRKMPMEIALLPMIESAYNPVAYSRAHASGIWQFIPSTGKDFGLRQNWWYDGRRDIIAATEAALDYLQKLHRMFNDWQLALAAYNWGEGAVGRAMERNRAKGLPTDYESLPVPAETRAYIPKLMAVKNIIMNPARFALSIGDVPNEPYFETVTLKRHIDMKLAAKLAEMTVEEFRFLNPGHNKPVIKAGEAERIVLPKDKVAPFLANFEKYDKPLVSWQTVTLKRGQKVEKVAEEHGMSVAELKQVNGLQNQVKLVVGQPLLVPVKGGVEDPHLPDLPVVPVTLAKAFEAAKNAAQSRKYAPAAHNDRNSRKAVVQKAVQKRAAAAKATKQPTKHLRAENARRVKVVAKSGSGKKAAAQVASR